MNDIKYVINFTYNLMNNTILTFGSYSFSCFDIMISFFCISIAAYFVYKLFDSV